MFGRTFGRMILGGLVIVALVGAAAPSHASVSVNIGINVPAPPRLVIVPGTPVLYAPSVHANYFFYGGQYYVFTNGFWYVGPRHNGPWVVVEPAFVPRPILTVPVSYYRVPPRHWRAWHREAPPHWGSHWGRKWEERERREGFREERREERREGREERWDDRRGERHEGRGGGRR
jgi:hypothetical protein